MKLISNEGIKLPKLNGFHTEIEVIELKEGLYKLKSGKHSVNVSKKKLAEIVKQCEVKQVEEIQLPSEQENEEVDESGSDESTEFGDYSAQEPQPEAEVEAEVEPESPAKTPERIAQEEKARSLGVKGNIARMGDDTLAKKIAEKEAEANA